MIDTHYIPAFTMRSKPGMQRAACQRWVIPEDHDVEPTCLRCQTWLAAGMEAAAVLEGLWRREYPEAWQPFMKGVSHGHDEPR